MNTQRILALVKMEMKKTIREPAFLFIMLLFPAVLTITFGFTFGDPELGMDFNAMAPGLFAYAIIFIIMTVAQSFSEMREQGLLRRLNTTPMTSTDFMTSEFLSNMFIAMLQVIIVYLLALPFGFHPTTNVGGLLFALLIMAVFSLSSVGLGLITATISKSSGTATGISFIFILPQMFFGTFIPITDTTRPIAMILPSYYATDAMSSIFSGASLLSINILRDFAFISTVSVLIMLLGIYLFEKFGNY
ncbi:MAG: ABC transporter permease [Candidatus Korarchaeota archaeon]|nr:ABC transporter permease [Candidatus Korarchaeota archaeon]NIU84064.1 ABC transporter permease [Candidatus Thorarchaeota archaeon]NIW12779.1 ABC transporter permease [Candidatus Thorarchaeota archaeon]NIW50986.1 ABC transporter permease [Candidatus Korarchaeota archaeon]